MIINHILVFDWAAFHTNSLLIGWTAGSVVMMLLCTLFRVTLSR